MMPPSFKRNSASCTSSGWFSTNQPAPTPPPISSSAVARKITSRLSGTQARLSVSSVMSCAIASPFISSAPRPQTYPSCTTPENGSTVQYSGVASTTSIWLSRMRGRALPSPFRRAYRFALPARGSNTWASMPSRASTAFSQCAVWSSLPGGLVVLIATYCDSRAAASRPTARPTARGWTNTCAPNPLTLMIELSLADQETARLVSKLPAASRRSARNVMPLSPTARSAVLGTTVTVATGAGAATLMLASPVFPSLVARSEARPAARARIVAEGPFTLVISTIEASVLDHDTDRLLRMLPAASRGCAVNVALSPPVRLALPGTTVTVATGVARPTVIVACPVLPWLVANTVAAPGARPRARSPLHEPQGYTKTTVVSELDQDAPASSTCPAESRTTASRNTPLSPTDTVALCGTMVTVATDPNTTTWTMSESLSPAVVA